MREEMLKRQKKKEQKETAKRQESIRRSQLRDTKKLTWANRDLSWLKIYQRGERRGKVQKEEESRKEEESNGVFV
jgi:hypothetical protein